MDAAHVVLILATVIAVLAIAAYLIMIVVYLRAVCVQLDNILAVVGEVIDKTEGFDDIMNEVASDLAEGQKAVEGCVARLGVGAEEHVAARGW